MFTVNAFIALGILALVYVLIIQRRQLGNIPIWTSMTIGALFMVLLQVISVESAFEAINLDIILFLFGMFSIVSALEKSGVLGIVAIKMVSRTKGNPNYLLFHRDNIVYDVFPAEKANIEENSVDLITVAQAAHWFDLTKFYQEVRRVSNGNDGIIAIWSYGMHRINPKIDMISEKLTVGGEILGNYWPKETIYVKEDYKTIPFPFKEITIPKLEMKLRRSLYLYGNMVIGKKVPNGEKI